MAQDMGCWSSLHGSNVCHPHCVLYNSKELGMLTLTFEHNYNIIINIVVFDCKC